MYTLSASDKFKKQVRKLAKKDLILKRRTNKTLKLLKKDVEYPSLRLHKLSGTNTWSVSVDKSIRIIVRIVNSKIYLLAVGKHEEVY